MLQPSDVSHALCTAPWCNESDGYVTVVQVYNEAWRFHALFPLHYSAHSSTLRQSFCKSESPDMASSAPCPIWKTAAVMEEQSGSDREVLDSPRAGGKYSIGRTAAASLDSRDNLFKMKLTSLLVERRRVGEQVPEITSTTIEEAEGKKILPVSERGDRTLRFLHDRTKHAGDQIRILPTEDTVLALNDSLLVGQIPVKYDMTPYYYTLQLLATSESQNIQEVLFLLQYLDSQNWISFSYGNTSILTVQGHARLADLDTKHIHSSRAFVAMWFDESMVEAWRNGIRRGVMDAGYEPIRIDQREHVNKIDDEIIAEIRRSRFVVADFSQGETGARGGVYCEAGFAHGLNIPVIFSCQKRNLDDVHFDIRQYNHIVWETPEELRRSLASRISAVIGDGPHRKEPVLAS